MKRSLDLLASRLPPVGVKKGQMFRTKSCQVSKMCVPI